MYDGGKIITGLVIFVALVTFPFWGNVGSADYKRPELQKVTNAKDCIESVDYMRGNHMQLLDEWRDASLREGKRIYTNSEGKEFYASLTLTCLECHTKKDEFCDRCHNSLAVSPYCWDCHIDSEGKS